MKAERQVANNFLSKARELSSAHEVVVVRRLKSQGLHLGDLISAIVVPVVILITVEVLKLLSAK